MLDRSNSPHVPPDGGMTGSVEIVNVMVPPTVAVPLVGEIMMFAIAAVELPSDKNANHANNFVFICVPPLLAEAKRKHISHRNGTTRLFNAICVTYQRVGHDL